MKKRIGVVRQCEGIGLGQRFRDTTKMFFVNTPLPLERKVNALP
jgi:hypothetical protein